MDEVLEPGDDKRSGCCWWWGGGVKVENKCDAADVVDADNGVDPVSTVN